MGFLEGFRVSGFRFRVWGFRGFYGVLGGLGLGVSVFRGFGVWGLGCGFGFGVSGCGFGGLGLGFGVFLLRRCSF